MSAAQGAFVADFELRPIRPEDDAAVASIIRAVMPEFGAGGEGFAIHDPEVDHMSRAYTRDGHCYFVVEHDGRVVGGGGIGALVGGEPGTCELRKMYFLPEARGHGLGRRLLARCLEAAAAMGYRVCYLETLSGMDAAQHLYEAFGFRRLPGPLGVTGHHGCDRWYAKAL